VGTGEQNKQLFEPWQMEAFVGSNVEYYEGKWGNSSGNSGSNWAGFFTGLIWAVYRKMYLEAVIVWVIVVVLSYILQADWPVWIGGIIFGFGGNEAYRWKLERIVKKSQGLEREEQEALLKQKGGTNPILAAIVVGLIFLPLFL